MLTLGGGLAFASPWLLVALAALPVLWWLLRLTPPSPKLIPFPAIRLLFGLTPKEETPHRTPWWLILLRLAIAALIIVGLSHPLARQLTLTGEVAAFRDDDPAGHSTDTRVAGSLAWQVSQGFQLDFEADAGLSSGAPDRSLAFGLAWQFR